MFPKHFVWLRIKSLYFVIKKIFLPAFFWEVHPLTFIWSNRTPFRKFLIKHIAQLYFTPWLGHNIIIAKGGFLAFFRWFSFSSWLLHLFNVLTRARVYTTVIWLKNGRKIIHNLIPDGFPTREARRALEGHQLLKNAVGLYVNFTEGLILLFFLVFHNVDFQRKMS